MNTPSRTVYLIGGTLIMLVVTISLFRISDSQTRRERAADAAFEQTFQKVDTSYDEITAGDLRKALLTGSGDVMVIDVRSSVGFVQEHLIRSVSMPAGTLIQGGVAPDYGKSLVVVVFDADENVPLGKVVEILRKNNRSVAVLSGGFDAWRTAGYPTISIGDPNDVADKAKVSYVPLDEIAAIVERKKAGDATDTVLVDVRSAAQYAEGHIPYAISLPLAEIEQSADRIPASKRVVTVGFSLVESFRGAVRFYDMNMPMVEAMDGGIVDWVRAGHQLTESSAKR